jgi:hypothetical protein
VSPDAASSAAAAQRNAIVPPTGASL